MLILALLAATAAPDAKTMANDDWHTLAITAVGADSGGPIYLQAHAGDLDGDGRPDDAVVKLVCAGSSLTNASYIVAPRDVASGMATGRRQYAPVKIVKEWGAASPQLRSMTPRYDVKAAKGARAAADGWTAIALSGADGLCGEAQSAAAAIVKSKSNITNN
jgi:hypothetical protein